MDKATRLKKNHAELWMKEKKYHELLYDDEILIRAELEKQARQNHPDLFEALQDARADRKHFESTLLAEPAAFDILECWMVDIVGRANSEDNGEAIFESFLDTGNMHNAVTTEDNVCGLLQQYLEEHEFTITDAGGGAGRCHLGAPCNDKEYRRIIKLVKTDFAEFFEEDVIYMKRMIWGVNWPDMRNWHDAELFLEEL